MGSDLTTAERLKLELFAHGIGISQSAQASLDGLRGSRRLTPADYASTSGLILRLDEDVWVNAPYRAHNPNFVDATPYVLDHDGDGFHVHGAHLESRAKVWLPPLFHGAKNTNGKPLNNYVFTHADRVRLSPVMGCSMTCKFCNIPYEDRYGRKPVGEMVEAVRIALADELQPARHILISGGTPKQPEFEYLQSVYRTILTSFPDLEVDIMMVPVDGLLDVKELKDLGVSEVSINIEVSNEAVAARIMRQKHRQGIETYLRFIAEASEILGPGRVRSMVMVGLESAEDSLRGVKAIVDHGGIPVLSPFRPDPATPLADTQPPGADLLEEVFLGASEITASAGVELGPRCPPCTHNTLTLPSFANTQVTYTHPIPSMV